MTKNNLPDIFEEDLDEANENPSNLENYDKTDEEIVRIKGR